MEIVKYPSPILRTVCEEVTKFDDELKVLAEEMLCLLPKVQGVGLAAPQVGRNIRLFVIQLPDEVPLCVVNPKVKEIRLEGYVQDLESCLSLPGFTWHIRRARRVTMEGWTLAGESLIIEGEGLMARALQHEIEHLNGILLLDRLSKVDSDEVREKVKRQGVL